MSKIKKNKKHLLTIFITIAVCALVFGAIWGIALNTVFDQKEEKSLSQEKESTTEVVEKPLIKAKKLSWQDKMTKVDKEYVTFALSFDTVMVEDVNSLGQSLIAFDYLQPDTVDAVKTDINNLSALVKVYHQDAPEPNDQRLKEINRLHVQSLNYYEAGLSVLTKAVDNADPEGVSEVGGAFKKGAKSFEDASDMLEAIILDK